MNCYLKLFFNWPILASGDANQNSGMSRSVPSSPGDRKPQTWGEPLPIVGSAESLVGRVSKISKTSPKHLVLGDYFMFFSRRLRKYSIG